MKYLKSLLYVLITLLSLTLITNIFYYFNVIGSNTIKYLNLIIPVLSLIVGGIYIGRLGTNKGYLEGLKVGDIVILLFLTFSFLGLNKDINIKNIIYYIVLLLTSAFGGIIGINKKKTNN